MLRRKPLDLLDADAGAERAQLDIERAVFDGGEHLAGLGQSAQVDEVAGRELLGLELGFGGLDGGASAAVGAFAADGLQPLAAVVGTTFGQRLGLLAAALSVELLESGADAAAEGGELVLHGSLSAGEQGVAFGLDRLTALGQAGADLLGLLSGDPLGADLVGDRIALLLELAEQLLH